MKNLIPNDDTFTSLPALTHDRVFKSLANDIFNNGVWNDFPTWDKNYREGIFVVEFFSGGVLGALLMSRRYHLRKE